MDRLNSLGKFPTEIEIRCVLCNTDTTNNPKGNLSDSDSEIEAGSDFHRFILVESLEGNLSG